MSAPPPFPVPLDSGLFSVQSNFAFGHQSTPLCNTGQQIKGSCMLKNDAAKIQNNFMQSTPFSPHSSCCSLTQLQIRLNIGSALSLGKQTTSWRESVREREMERRGEGAGSVAGAVVP